MKILALDSSTAACTVAVCHGEQVIERYEMAPRQHAQLLLPMVNECLAEAGITLNQLDSLAFVAGPGSFTGLRIAASVIQGLAYAANLPVVPVSSLRTLAQSASRLYQAEQVLATIDARMQEVYWGVYQIDSKGIMQAKTEDSLYSPDDCPRITGQEWQALGSGWDHYGDILEKRYAGQLDVVHREHFPHAQDIATLAVSDYTAGLAVAADKALPVYIRNKVTNG